MKQFLVVWVWMWLVMLLLLLVGMRAKAEWYDDSALERALYERMVVWKTPKGKSVTIRHCGNEDECKERIKQFASWIQKAAIDYRLDQWMLGAIAFHESGMNPFAVGGVGEMGIFQLHPKGAGKDIRFVQNEGYRQSCAFEPGACQEEVIFRAARLLREGLDKCKSPDRALGYFNSGFCQKGDYSKRILWQRGRLITHRPKASEGLGWCQYCPPNRKKASEGHYPLHCGAPL